MRVLWSINVYSRVADAIMHARQIKLTDFKPDVMVVTTGNHGRETFDEINPVDFIRLPNPENPKQQGNLDVVRATIESSLAEEYDLIVCAHADTLWTNLSGVEALIAHLAGNPHLNCAATLGREGGFLGNKTHLGVFYDILVFRQGCLPALRLEDWTITPGGWCEVQIHDIMQRVGDVFLFPSVSRRAEQDHTGKRLDDIMGIPGSCMMLGHDLEWKLDRLHALNPTLYARLLEETGSTRTPGVRSEDELQLKDD